MACQSPDPDAAAGNAPTVPDPNPAPVMDGPMSGAPATPGAMGGPTAPGGQAGPGRDPDRSALPPDAGPAAPEADAAASAPDAAASPDPPPAQTPDAGADTPAPQTVPSVSFILPPEGGTVWGTVRLQAVGRDVAIETLEVWVDGALRNRVSGGPPSIDWAAFRETLGAHVQAAHQLTVVAIDRTGQRHQKRTTVRVVPPVRGDCDSNGVLNGADSAAADAEATDGDGSDPESTPGGTFLGSPACDANDDNVVDHADAICIDNLFYGPPGYACASPQLPAVRPILFLPIEYHHLAASDELPTFLREKLEEVRRFVARHNRGRTFRATPVEVIRGPQPRDYYVENAVINYENVLSDIPLPGYVEPSNKALTLWNRLVWVFVLGGSDSISYDRYPTGHGYALVGDAYLYGARDLGCARVNPVAPGDRVHETCLATWMGSGRMYGHTMGHAVKVLLAALGVPPVEPRSPDHSRTVLGDHTGYPESGFTEADRAVLGVSHFLPGSQDPAAPLATILAPTADAALSGVVFIRAVARDNYALRAISLDVDGRRVSLDAQTLCPHGEGCPRSPFDDDGGAIGVEYTWDTAGEAPGPHTITFRADDPGGNTTTVTTTVTVQP
jgi:hypothetical protein